MGSSQYLSLKIISSQSAPVIPFLYLCTAHVSTVFLMFPAQKLRLAILNRKKVYVCICNERQSRAEQSRVVPKRIIASPYCSNLPPVYPTNRQHEEIYRVSDLCVSNQPKTKTPNLNFFISPLHQPNFST